MKKSIILPFLVLFLCLSACANKPANNGLGNENPFAATGLLAHPNETAEEILLRAHAYDQEAMLLAFAGYSFGIGGFPKDEELGWEWHSSYNAVNSDPTSMFVAAISFHIKYPALLGPGMCYMANQSFAVPLFKQAGIFDLGAVCQDMKDVDEELKQEIAFSINEADLHRKLLIELISRPMTKQEAKLLDDLSYYSKGFVAYYISNAGEKDVSPQEKRLNFLRFIAQREGESFQRSKELKEIAANTLMQIDYAEAHRPDTMEMVSKAHQGDPIAAQQMAENYRTGGIGFFKDKRLVAPWLKRAFNAGDKKSLDSLVLWSSADSLPEYAWKYAHIALLYGSPEMKEVFTFIIKEKEKGFTVEELQGMQKELDEELEHMQVLGPQIK